MGTKAVEQVQLEILRPVELYFYQPMMKKICLRAGVYDAQYLDNPGKDSGVAWEDRRERRWIVITTHQDGRPYYIGATEKYFGMLIQNGSVRIVE